VQSLLLIQAMRLRRSPPCLLPLLGLIGLASVLTACQPSGDAMR
jgi:hypothetical protein